VPVLPFSVGECRLNRAAFALRFLAHLAILQLLLNSPVGSKRPPCGSGCSRKGRFMKTGSAYAYPIFFSGFYRSSRNERPDGSGHPFGWGGATPIRSVTDRHSLFPSSPTRTSIASPCGSVSFLPRQSGDVRAYRVASL
jgi:hypothetical protein